MLIQEWNTKVLFLSLFAKFLPSFLSMNKHIIRVSEPLFLCLADFPESTPVV